MSNHDDPAQANLVTAGVIGDVSAILRAYSQESTTQRAYNQETAAQRMHLAIAIDTAEWLERRIRHLEEGFERLHKERVDVKASDARAIAEGIARAHRAT